MSDLKKVKNEYIILFDGICNFCNSSVNFIIDKDNKHMFKFSSLQSLFGKETLRKFNLPVETFSSLILTDGNAYYTHSSAALRIARHLSFPYNLLYILIIVPPFIRNYLYDIVARNRYKWFGKRDSCRLPSNEERDKFIN